MLRLVCIQVFALMVALQGAVESRSTLTSQSASAIPPGPSVYEFEGHYHLKGCARLPTGREPIALREAVRGLLGSCPVCKPIENQDVRSYISNHTAAIGREEAAAREDRIRREPVVRLAEDQVRTIAKQVAASSEFDRAKFASLFRQEIRSLLPAYEEVGLMVHSSESLSVVITGPVNAFGFAAGEQVRKMEPVEKTPWVPYGTVIISVRTITAPDIERVVVIRNGAIIEPAINDLKPTPMRTRMGAEVIIHTGTVAFPLSAFDPNAESVVLTLIPAQGENIVRRFMPSELRRVR